MDNRGLFHSISIVSDNLDKAQYLESLRQNVVNVLKDNNNKYSSIALHAPFRISKEEIAKIAEAVSDHGSSIEFIVIRLNQYNKFYGYNKTINTLVPYESSLMPIGEHEYLLWTEGVTSIDKTAKKRYSGPILIDIMYQNVAVSSYDSYLQDLINLSGMNWRAYNSKAVPLSIQYCQLVTDFVEEFQERGFPKLTEDNLKPWFL